MSVPHAVIDECERDWKYQSLPGLHALKRGRPTELRVPTTLCTQPCCVKNCVVSFGYCCQHQQDSMGGVKKERNLLAPESFPEFPIQDDDFDQDEDFELGPPPPSCPVLVRQKAMDFSTAVDGKPPMLMQNMDPKLHACVMSRSTSRISTASPANPRGRFMAI